MIIKYKKYNESLRSKLKGKTDKEVMNTLLNSKLSSLDLYDPSKKT